MELKNDRSALLDKIHVYGFIVTNVFDLKDLVKKGIVSVKNGQNKYIPTVSGEGYSGIQIGKNELFDSFYYSINNEGFVSGCIQISINDKEYHNLNCFTTDEYRKRIHDIQEFLTDKYGIEVRFDEAKFKYLEINKTIVINGCFEDYGRPLNMISQLFPARLKLKVQADYKCPERDYSNEKKKTKSIYKSSGQRGINIDIYDKSDQLEKTVKIKVEHNYLRFEIALKSAEKIEKELGTKSIWSLTDKMINKYFSDFLRKNVEEPFLAYQEKKERILKKIVRDTYVYKRQGWVKDFLLRLYDYEAYNKCPLILSIEEVIYFFEKNKRLLPNKYIRKNTKKQLLNYYEDGKLKTFFRGDFLKAQELISKLSNSKIEL